MPEKTQAVGLSPYISIKDLAQIMGLSTKSVKRVYKRLNVPPTVDRHACQRWTFRDASRLLRAWEGQQTAQPSNTSTRSRAYAS